MPLIEDLMASELPRQLDTQTITWGCVFVGVLLHPFTFYASMIHSAISNPDGYCSEGNLALQQRGLGARLYSRY